jgi:serine/threonine protein kinase
MEEPLQRSLERYDVLDRIAVGGMAEVFLAKAYGAHGFEKTLAIKRILPELASDPEFAARFIAEAKVAVRLSHANVVQVFDFGRIGESLFIAMEFVDGLDLAAMLRKFKDDRRQVPLPAAFHIAIEIVRALDFAHSHNVVHRDVSPSNILISRAGEVKIADFGIAIAASPHRGGGPPGPRKVMGKWRYMSPEQARGDTLDTRSDLFSAASVMFELFTGEKLFPGDEAEDIIKNIEAMPIPKMSAMRAGLPTRLDDVLAVALARKPIDRPSRPASVLRSLIELSYESSIMATALDVAEALATVIPAKRQSGRGALDDVIRRQLADQSIARRTAVTDGKPVPTETELDPTSTGLFRKLGSDGLAHLEEVDANLAGDEEPIPDVPVVSQLQPYEPTKDPDRRTEVGGPPTGQVPKSDLSNQHARLPGDRARAGRRARIWIAAAAAVAAAGGLTWRFVRSPATAHNRTIASLTPSDADVAEPKGTLELDSIPSGAIVTIADHVLGPAPRSARVSSGVKIHIRLELKGFQVYDDELSVDADKTVVLRPRLSPAPAMLHVETAPPGATATLAGQVIGTTPLTTAAAVGHDTELMLSKTGHESVRLKIDLRAGEQTDVVRELKELQKFGVVLVVVNGAATWGYVWFKGKNLGQNYTIANGQTPFTLPIGRQQLQIAHPKAPPKIVTVDVAERGPTRLIVTL